MFTAFATVLLFLSTHVQSRNLLLGKFDDDAGIHPQSKNLLHSRVNSAASASRLEKFKKQLIKPLGSPPDLAFVQQSPPGFKPPTQEICDKVADMAKGEMEVIESTCDAVIYGGSAKAPMGCECHFLGDKVKCPWAAPNANVAKTMQDMGFNRLDNMGANAGPGSGGFKIQNCMYMAYRDPWSHTVEGSKIMQVEDHDDVLRMAKAIDQSTDWAFHFEEAPRYAATIGPWPVDEYGTPHCFGRCTTNPPNVWLRYTTTAAPGLL